MNIPTPTQIANLPKWAQQHIQQLEQDRVQAVRKLNDYRDCQSESRIYTRDGLDPKCWIQTDRVHCVFKNGEMQVAVRGEELEVMGTFGIAELAVFPQSGNVVALRIQRRA